MLPAVGLLCAAPAILMGRRGAKLSRERPELGGAAHARMGMIGGAVFGAVWLALIGRVAWVMTRG